MTHSASPPADSVVYHIPIAQLEAYRGRGLIVRSDQPSAIASRLGADDLANLAYVQLTSLRSDPDALVQWAEGLPIELLLDGPALDFASLYRYAKLLDNHPVRVLLPVTPGFEKAARLACSLQFAVRLNIGQPSAPLIGAACAPAGRLPPSVDDFTADRVLPQHAARPLSPAACQPVGDSGRGPGADTPRRRTGR